MRTRIFLVLVLPLGLIFVHCSHTVRGTASSNTISNSNENDSSPLSTNQQEAGDEKTQLTEFVRMLDLHFEEAEKKIAQAKLNVTQLADFLKRLNLIIRKDKSKDLTEDVTSYSTIAEDYKILFISSEMGIPFGNKIGFFDENDLDKFRRLGMDEGAMLVHSTLLSHIEFCQTAAQAGYSWNYIPPVSKACRK